HLLRCVPEEERGRVDHVDEENRHLSPERQLLSGKETLADQVGCECVLARSFGLEILNGTHRHLGRKRLPVHASWTTIGIDGREWKAGLHPCGQAAREDRDVRVTFRQPPCRTGTPRFSRSEAVRYERPLAGAIGKLHWR